MNIQCEESECGATSVCSWKESVQPRRNRKPELSLTIEEMEYVI